jgi:uncharacterized protein YceK
MVELVAGLLSLVVFLGGLAVVIVATHDPRDLASHLATKWLRTTSDLRKPARWCYVVIAILSFVISMGDLPRSRRDADLLWIVPISIVMDGLLWPLALARRITPDWWSSEEY